MKKITLDKDEKEILKAFEKGNLHSVPLVKKEISRYREYALNSLRKNARINVRMASRDVLQIKQKVQERGIPYQTLIASILHQFATGRLSVEN